MAERLFFQRTLTEAGCDEAGRGCLAGPVVAAAVILPKGFHKDLVDDSKALNHEQRMRAAKIIKKRAIAWAVSVVDVEMIDKINILKASMTAMHFAVHGLTKTPSLLIIDGNYFVKYPGIPHKCVVKGDSIVASVAAASILAKTHRDALMVELHKKYPQYGWDRNKGYGTAFHRQAILDFGITEHHRKTFAPVQDYIQTDLLEFIGEDKNILFED